jgi:hypothetical protein
MTDRPTGQSPKPSVFEGLVRLARGDAAGIMQFGHTPRAFLLSLIPLIALPLVVALGTLASGAFLRGISDLSAAVCVLLVPPVITHALAKRWNREGPWLRFATAFNWCQFGLSVLCMALLIGLGIVFGSAGAAPGSNGVVAAVALLCLGIVGYGLWLHWFVARWGLGVSGGRAVLVVIATYAGTFTILIIRGVLLMDRG